MAESLAIIGLVSSIIQFVDFGMKIITRLNEFNSRNNEIPGTFQPIQAQLPLLIDSLKETQKQANNGHVTEDRARALGPVIDMSISQVWQLDDILVKSLPGMDDTMWIRRQKALSSLALDRKVKEVTAALEKNVLIHIYHQATANLSDLEPRAREQRTSPGYNLSFQDPILKPTPCSTLKFSRDPKFVGREDILEEIDSTLLGRGLGRIALAGMGGVGKTQVAVEYTYRYIDHHPESHIFWIHANNYTRIEEGYRDIAKKLDLPGFDDPKFNAFVEVSNWLKNDNNSPWLLVLDSCDNRDVLFASASNLSSPQDEQEANVALFRYLPRSKNGRMIITTRDKRVGINIAGKEQTITIMLLGVEDAKCLLQTRLSGNNSWSNEELVEFLEALGFLPLAISHAAAFINENGISLSDYLELLRVDSDTKDLLLEEYHDATRDMDTSSSVFQTWKISFDQINEQKPTAARVLSLMALLDRQTIPATLVRSEFVKKTEFLTAIGTLKSFSLISEEREGETFGMHRLVQLSTQKWLEEKSVLLEWQERALEAIFKSCPQTSEYENWATWESLNPHIEVVLGYRFDKKEALLQRSNVLNVMACYDMARERLSAAYKGLKEALAIREKYLGQENIFTLHTCQNLGNIYSKLEKLAEAGDAYRRVLSGYEKLCEQDDILILNTLQNLSSLYLRQEKFTDAEIVTERALKGYEQSLGHDHQRTLGAIQTRGLIYGRQGKSIEAEAMFKKAWAGYDKTLDLEHTTTLSLISSLGSLYLAEGRLGEGETMLKQALTGYERTLGPDHTTSLTACQFLGVLYLQQNDLTTAEAFLKRSLEGYQRLLGPSHTTTLSSTLLLGLNHWKQAKINEAEALYQLVRKEIDRLGPDLSPILTAASRTALACWEHGDLEGAAALMRQVVSAKCGTMLQSNNGS